MTNENPDSVATLRLLAKCGSMDLSMLGPIADEMERLRAAMKGWSSYAWKDRCYVDDVQQYFDSVLKGDAPTSLDGIEVYDENLGKPA